MFSEANSELWSVDLHSFFADPDAAVFTMRIRVQLKNNLKKLDHERKIIND